MSRRFRNTYRKNETARPKGLRDYWLGYAGNSMDDLSSMVKDNAAFRERRPRSRIRFELPSAVSVRAECQKSSVNRSRPKTWPRFLSPLIEPGVQIFPHRALGQRPMLSPTEG